MSELKRKSVPHKDGAALMHANSVAKTKAVATKPPAKKSKTTAPAKPAPVVVQEGDDEELSIPEDVELIYLDAIDKQHNRSKDVYIQVKLVRKSELGKTKKGDFFLTGRFQDKNGNQIGFVCWTSKNKANIPELLYEALKLNDFYSICNFEVQPSDSFNKGAGPTEFFKLSIYSDGGSEGTIILPISQDDDEYIRLSQEFMEPQADFLDYIANIPAIYPSYQNTKGVPRPPPLNVVGVVTQTKSLYMWADPKQNGLKVPIRNVVIVDEKEVAIDVCLFGFCLNEIEYPVGCILRVDNAGIRSKNPNVFTLSCSSYGNVVIVNHHLVDQLNPRLERLRKWSLLNKSKIQHQYFESLSDFRRKDEDFEPPVSTTVQDGDIAVLPPTYQITPISTLLEYKEQAKEALTNAGIFRAPNLKKIPEQVVLPKGTYIIKADIMRVLLWNEKSKSIIDPMCINKKHPKVGSKTLTLSSTDILRCTTCKENADEWSYTAKVKLEVTDESHTCALTCFNLDPFLKEPYNIEFQDLIQEARKKQTDVDEDEVLGTKDHILYNEMIHASVNHLVTHPFKTYLITIKLVGNVYEGLNFQIIKVTEPQYYQDQRAEVITTSTITTTNDPAEARGQTTLAMAMEMFD